MAPKYRTNKVKHEHKIIPGIRALLERMADCPAIQAIIPGVISPNRSLRGLEITCQYPTDSGLRLLAKSRGAVQEVFVVTDRPATVQEWLTSSGLVRAAAVDSPDPPLPPAPPQPDRFAILDLDYACALCGRPIRAGTRALRHSQPYTFVHVRCQKRP